MPKLLVLKAQGRHVTWSCWASLRRFLAEKNHITWWILPAELTKIDSKLGQQAVQIIHKEEGEIKEIEIGPEEDGTWGKKNVKVQIVLQ